MCVCVSQQRILSCQAHTESNSVYVLGAEAPGGETLTIKAPGIHRNHGKALAFHRLEIQIKSVKFSMEHKRKQVEGGTSATPGETAMETESSGGEGKRQTLERQE